MTNLDRKYAALVNEMAGKRGYVKRAPEGRVDMAVDLARAALEGGWPGTRLDNRNSAEDLRAAAAELIAAADRVEEFYPLAA